MSARLEGSLSEAPQKRFRGKRRYFRRVDREARDFVVKTSPGDWWNLWHYHADWPGWGNLRWRYRRHHINALAIVFGKIAASAGDLPQPFQLWVSLEGGDSGGDAVYLHSPNPHSEFPVVLADVEWGVGLPDAGIAEAFSRWPLRVGVHTGLRDDITPPREVASYVIYSPDVGVPLEPGS